MTLFKEQQLKDLSGISVFESGMVNDVNLWYKLREHLFMTLNFRGIVLLLNLFGKQKMRRVISL